MLYGCKHPCYFTLCFINLEDHKMLLMKNIRTITLSIITPIIALTVLLSGAAILLSGAANALDGREVMEKVQEQGRIHKTQSSEVELLIIDAQERERKRFFKTKQLLDEAKSTHTLVNFYKPASVKGTGLLTEKADHATKANQWLYLPAFRTVKQLRSDEQDDSFMGSDFSFSDVAGRTLDQDQHRLVKENDKYYFIQSIPVDKTEAYNRLDLVVSKKFLVPLQIVFYNKSNEKFKTLTNQGIQEIKGMFVVQKALMENHITNGNSTMTRSDTKVGIKVHPNDVSIKALKKS